MAGFGLSTALLALASLAATPAMVRADGPAAWGAVAIGQSIGAIASIIVGYGWAAAGPSRIARADPSIRLREFADSLRVKLTLLMPAAGVAALLAALASPHNMRFAAAGGLSATVVALSSGWYFSGLMKPYTWILLETLPRVTGTAIGIALMASGHGVITGLACTAGGMVAGLVVVTVWVYRSAFRAGASMLPRMSFRDLLAARRDGILSMIGAPLFFAAPLAIVSLWSSQGLPVFALADKVRQLVSSGLSPLVVYLQGWVPRGGATTMTARGRVAILAAFAVGVSICAIFVPLGPDIMHWLGAGQVAVPSELIILTGLTIALDLLNSVLAYAVIASLGRLGIASRAMAVSLVLMIPVVYFGTRQFGVVGALAGTVLGLIVRLGIEFRGISFLRSRTDVEPPWTR